MNCKNIDERVLYWCVCPAAIKVETLYIILLSFKVLEENTTLSLEWRLWLVVTTDACIEALGLHTVPRSRVLIPVIELCLILLVPFIIGLSGSAAVQCRQHHKDLRSVKISGLFLQMYYWVSHWLYLSSCKEIRMQSPEENSKQTKTSEKLNTR